MRKFTYSLERVLEIRDVKRLLARETFGRDLQNEHNARKNLDKSLNRRDDLHEALRKASEGSLDTGNIRHLLMCRQWVEDEIYLGEGELGKMQAILQNSREKVLMRTREHRVLETLKEKALKDYMERYWWEQAKQTDESGTARFLRKGRW